MSSGLDLSDWNPDVPSGEVRDGEFQGEKSAIAWFDDLLKDISATLKSESVVLEDGERWLLGQTYAQTPPAFRFMAALLEPLRVSEPEKFKVGYNSLYQLMLGAFHAGGLAWISESSWQYLRRPFTQGGRKGGEKSAAKRRVNADKNPSKKIVETMAVDLRTQLPGTSQETLVQKIRADWKIGKIPSETFIRNTIRELEKSGKLKIKSSKNKKMRRI